MEERKIIESKHYKIKLPLLSILSLIILIIGLSITLIMAFDGLNSSVTCHQNVYEYYREMYASYGADFAESLASSYAGTQEGFVIKHFFYGTCLYHSNALESLIPLRNCFIISLSLLAISLVVFLEAKHCSLTVTDARIYGKTMFGNRVELPIDSISMITTISLLKGIVVTTSLKKKKVFLLIKNLDEVYRELNDLVIEKRQNTKVTNGDKENQPIINAEELKKMKELLDMGIITQEEFDAKKKQLLGL